jgi:DNA-binding transcriptional ArsR family regulator
MQLIDVEVIEKPEKAAAMLAPVRSRILAELAVPASAASLAERLGISRQKINYHLKALEAHDLVEVAETRKWGGITERLLVASANSYLVSPTALGSIGADPARNTDRLSASYLIALAGRIVREVGQLWHRALKDGKRLATLSIDTEIRFRSAAERATFTKDLTHAITTLAARYHDEQTDGGRRYRLLVASYPAPVSTITERTDHADQKRRNR